MYQPSVENAAWEQDKHELAALFESSAHFIRNLNLRRGHWVAAELSGRHFIDCEFTNVQLLGLKLNRCEWTDTHFAGCEWRDLILRDCSFRRCRFSATALASVRFENCYFEECEIDLRDAGVELVDCIVRGSSAKSVEPAPAIQKAPETPKAPAPQAAAGPVEPASPKSKTGGRFGHLDLDAPERPR